MTSLNDSDLESEEYTRRESLLLSLLNQAAHFYEDTIGILSGIFKLSEYVRQGSPESDFYSYLVKVLLEESRCENASVFIVEAGRLVLKAASGMHVGEANKSVCMDLGDGVAGRCALSGDFVLVSDVHNCEFFSPRPDTRVPLGSLLCVPIKEGGRTIGVLNLSHSQREFFNIHDVRMFELLGMLVGQMLTLLGLYEVFRSSYIELEENLNRTDADLKSISGCYRSVVDAAEVLILMIEGDKVKFYNRALHEMLEDEPHSLAQVMPGAAAAIMERAAHLKEDESLDLDLPLQIGRHSFTGALIIKRILGEQVLIIIKDITLRHSLRAQSMQTEKLASLGLLTSGIAHELNNKLTPILGFADLIDTSYLKPKDLERLQVLKSAAESTKTIIDSLLTFSRNVPPSRTSFDLRELIDRAISLYHPTTIKRSIEILHERAESPVKVLADMNCFEQVLVNLINNAIDAIGDQPGRIVITSACTANQACLNVSDSGQGVAADVLPKVFDPFFTTKACDQGTGLGLSICYGIVHDHGGQISIENGPGGGAEVRITLPLDHQLAAEPPAAEPSCDYPPKAGREGDLHLMLVEDESYLRELLQDALGARYCLSSFANGLEALNHLHDRDWSLIISDLRMPEMDGMEFYRRAVASRAQLAGLFLFTTGDTYDLEVKAFLEDTRVDYIRKPFRIKELLGKVSQRLAQCGEEQ
jgi:signal transduction histidine kinase/CheY-like chemotaxis protein